MGAKGSGAPVAYPGAKLAKGWGEQTEREKDKAKAVRRLFTLLNAAVSIPSRAFLYHVVFELARKWMALATLEEIRALTIEFEEYTS